MPQGITPKLPLVSDDKDGKYRLLKNLRQVVKQNFKNLVLTIPGERIMMPKFGVGIKRYLFEQNTAATQGNIAGKIREQARKYLPFIDIQGIYFYGPEDNPELPSNSINVQIRYRIIPISSDDTLDLLIRESV